MFHLKLCQINRLQNSDAVLCWVTQSCPTLCDPMDCSLPGFSVYGDSPGKNTGVGCHALLQGIFPTQGSDPGVLHCRQILHQLSHQGRRQNSDSWDESTGVRHPAFRLGIVISRMSFEVKDHDFWLQSLKKVYFYKSFFVWFLPWQNSMCLFKTFSTVQMWWSCLQPHFYRLLYWAGFCSEIFLWRRSNRRNLLGTWMTSWAAS